MPAGNCGSGSVDGLVGGSERRGFGGEFGNSKF